MNFWPFKQEKTISETPIKLDKRRMAATITINPIATARRVADLIISMHSYNFELDSIIVDENKKLTLLITLNKKDEELLNDVVKMHNGEKKLIEIK